MLATERLLQIEQHFGNVWFQPSWMARRYD